MLLCIGVKRISNKHLTMAKEAKGEDRVVVHHLYISRQPWTGLSSSTCLSISLSTSLSPCLKEHTEQTSSSSSASSEDSEKFLLYESPEKTTGKENKQRSPEKKKKEMKKTSFMS